MLSPGSPSSTLAERRADAELAGLRRQFTHGLTALDVSRRQWSVASAAGKAQLTMAINARSCLQHAESADWPPGAMRLRGGVAMSALRQRRSARVALSPLMLELEDIVGRMRSTADSLRERRDAVAMALGEQQTMVPLIHTEPADRILSHVEAIVSAYERELRLRRSIATELMGIAASNAEQPAAAFGSEDGAARVYLSAWVLEPYLDSELGIDLLLDGLSESERPSVSPRR